MAYGACCTPCILVGAKLFSLAVLALEWENAAVQHSFWDGEMQSPSISHQTALQSLWPISFCLQLTSKLRAFSFSCSLRHKASQSSHISSSSPNNGTLVHGLAFTDAISPSPNLAWDPSAKRSSCSVLCYLLLPGSDMPFLDKVLRGLHS